MLWCCLTVCCTCFSDDVDVWHVAVQVKTAVQDGYDLRGYHYWTLLVRPLQAQVQSLCMQSQVRLQICLPVDLY